MSSYFDLQLFSFNATSLVQWLIIAILLLNVQSVPFLWHRKYTSLENAMVKILDSDR